MGQYCCNPLLKYFFEILEYFGIFRCNTSDRFCQANVGCLPPLENLEWKLYWKLKSSAVWFHVFSVKESFYLICIWSDLVELWPLERGLIPRRLRRQSVPCSNHHPVTCSNLAAQQPRIMRVKVHSTGSKFDQDNLLQDRRVHCTFGQFWKPLNRKVPRLDGWWGKLLEQGRSISIGASQIKSKV